MEPGSDTPHPPSPSGYVQIPQALADRLFHCYYGNGPRKGQSPASLSTELNTVPPASITEPEGELDAPRTVLRTDLLPKGYAPKGFALRTSTPAPETRHAQ